MVCGGPPRYIIVDFFRIRIILFVAKISSTVGHPLTQKSGSGRRRRRPARNRQKSAPFFTDLVLVLGVCTLRGTLQVGERVQHVHRTTVLLLLLLLLSRPPPPLLLLAAATACYCCCTSMRSRSSAIILVCTRMHPTGLLDHRRAEAAFQALPSRLERR